MLGLTALTYWIDSSAVLGFGPGGAVEVFGGELGGVDDDVADLFPLPGVGDVNQAIVGLDDGRVGVFAGLRFEQQSGLPVLAIFGEAEAKGRAAAWRVVVNEQVRAVFQRHAVDARVGVGEANRRDGRPRLAAVRGSGSDHLLDFARTGEHEELILAQGEDRGLNCFDIVLGRNDLLPVLECGIDQF